jgi:hypothetical protein
VVSSSILSVEVYRSFDISIFIPSHQDGFFEEWESAEFSLSIDLDGGLACIDRFPDIRSF